MNSTRISLILGYSEKVETELGVWEDRLNEIKVKSEQERIYQRRLDRAMQEGFVLTARFRIRRNFTKIDLKYAVWNGRKYKINRADDSMESHYTIIELGELI
jgi:hypothetical protein